MQKHLKCEVRKKGKVLCNGRIFSKFILLLFECRHIYVGDYSSQKRVRDPLQLELQEVVSFSYGLGTERGSSVRVANILGHCAVSADPTGRMSAERMKAFLCLSLLLKSGCPSRENCVSHKYSLTSEAYFWMCASH